MVVLSFYVKVVQIYGMFSGTVVVIHELCNDYYYKDILMLSEKSTQAKLENKIIISLLICL